MDEAVEGKEMEFNREYRDFVRKQSHAVQVGFASRQTFSSTGKADLAAIRRAATSSVTTLQGSADAQKLADRAVMPSSTRLLTEQVGLKSLLTQLVDYDIFYSSRRWFRKCRC